MHYRADVYKDTILKNSFVAGSVEVLRSKAEPYINSDKYNQIVVSKVSEIGYFKLPKEIEDVIEKEKML